MTPAARCATLAGTTVLVLVVPVAFDPSAQLSLSVLKSWLFWLIGSCTVGAATLISVASVLRTGFRPGDLLADWRAAWAGSLLVGPLVALAATWPISCLRAAAGGHRGGAVEPVDGLVSMLVGIGLSLAIASACTSLWEVSFVVRAILAGSLPIACYGVLQFVGLDPLAWLTDSIARLTSTIGRSVHLGAYLAMVAPLAFGHVLHEPMGWRSTRAGIVFGVQTLCLALTLARGAWLALAGGLAVVIALQALRSWSRVLVGWTVALLVLLATVPLVWPRLAMLQAAPSVGPERTTSAAMDFGALREASSKARLAIWAATLPLVRGHLLFGHGPGAYRDVFGGHRTATIDRYLAPETIIDSPHNLLLNIIFTCGIACLAPYLWLLARYYHITIASALRSQYDVIANLSAALSGSMTSYLISAQFNPMTVDHSVLFWFCIGLAGALWNVHRRLSPVGQMPSVCGLRSDIGRCGKDVSDSLPH